MIVIEMLNQIEFVEVLRAVLYVIGSFIMAALCFLFLLAVILWVTVVVIRQMLADEQEEYWSHIPPAASLPPLQIENIPMELSGEDEVDEIW